MYIKNVFYILIILNLSTISLLHAQEIETKTSPNRSWFDFPDETSANSKDLKKKSVKETSFGEKALYWIPNLLLDLYDVFKIDVGVGFSTGAVVRATKYAQAGYRDLNPVSIRVGMLGRQSPIIAETSNEIGISPTFKQSKDRKVCDGEFGAGLDLFVAGIYLGVCFDELADFASGIFMQDLKNDNIK